MYEEDSKLERREFLKELGVAGATIGASVLGFPRLKAFSSEEYEDGLIRLYFNGIDSFEEASEIVESENPKILEYITSNQAVLKVPEGMEIPYVAEAKQSKGVKNSGLNWKVCIQLAGKECSHEFMDGEIIAAFKTKDKEKNNKITQDFKPNLLCYNLEENSGIVEVLDEFEDEFINRYERYERVKNGELVKKR